MANKIVLGKRPKTFKEITVTVTLPDGSEGIIPVTFRYKTKKEFGAWQDAGIKQAGNMKDEAGNFSWVQFYEVAGDRSADLLLDIIDSWGLDLPLNKDTLLAAEEDCGAGVFPALFKAFGYACREGRLGN